jgi:hypothetical protein
MFNTRPKCGNVNALERIFENIQDDLVRSVTDSVDILISNACASGGAEDRRRWECAHNLPSVPKIARYDHAENIQGWSHEAFCVRIIGVRFVQLNPII